MVQLTTTPTARLQFEKQGYNANADTWGDHEATFKDMVDGALAGVTAISINGLSTYTLTYTQYQTCDFTNAVIGFTGTLGAPCTVTIPAVQKTTIWQNLTSGSQNVVLQVSGTANTFVLAPGSRYHLVCDGQQIYDAVQTIGGSLVVKGTLSAASITAGGGVLSVSVGGTGATDAAGAYANLTPPGVSHIYFGASPPSGWLLCQGQAVSRTVYANLFSILSTTYGAGDGVSTFNLPDARGRSLIGAGTGAGLSARTLGQTGGAESQAIAVSNLPAHNHTATSTSGSSSSASFSLSTSAVASTAATGYGSGPNNAASNVPISCPVSGSISVSTTTTTTTTIGNTGGNTPLSVMNPFLVANYIIKY